MKVWSFWLAPDKLQREAANCVSGEKVWLIQYKQKRSQCAHTLAEQLLASPAAPIITDCYDHATVDGERLLILWR